MTAPASSTRSVATLHSTRRGPQTVAWEIPLDVADLLTALLTPEIATGQSDPARARLAETLVPLRAAVSAGYEQMVTAALGCPHMQADRGLLLAEPAVLAASTGHVAVLLPGAHKPAEAAQTALTVLAAAGITVDSADPALSAEVGRPRWLLLHPCADPRHAAHPVLAPEGAATSDAMLATRVDFLAA